MICPVCKTTNDDNSSFCCSCGTNFQQHAKESRKKSLNLIISIINASVFLPFAFAFWVLLLIFGGLGGDTERTEITLWLVGFYIVGSVIYLLYAIYVMIKDNRIAKIIYWAIIATIILTFIIMYIMAKYT